MALKTRGGLLRGGQPRATMVLRVRHNALCTQVKVRVQGVAALFIGGRDPYSLGDA